MKTRTDVSRERASATATRIAFRGAVLWLGALLASLLILAVPAGAQAQGPPSTKDSGIDSDNYNFQQTIEFGGRVTDFTGSRDVYDTFVNLHSGVRLFEYTLNLRSLNHTGLFFDNLFWTNSGYGGDPNNFSMLRISKNKWYNFNGSFRRNLNFWNYNLLANPLNPVNTFIQVPFSPHSFHTVRRLSDLNLTLLPQSRFRFRVGYSRNISEGPVLSTIHQGTDALLFNEWKQTVNAYRFGVDYRGLPRTNISYDQTFTYYKGDNSYLNDPALSALLVGQNFQLSNGVAVDPGLVYNAAGNQPCSNAAPNPIFNTATDPPTLKSACNGYADPQGATILGAPRDFPYDRFGRARTNFPTEQLSFQSNYFKNLDMAGRLVYTSSDSKLIDFQEFYLGLVTRTNVRSLFDSGAPTSSRVSVTGDLGATYHITSKFRITDSFQFSSWRIPGLFLFTNLSLFATASPASLTGPIATQASDCLTTPCIHNSNSPADIANGISSSFLKQDTKSNQIEAEYDFTSKIGARVGYRYRHRTIAEATADSVTETFFPNTPNRGDCAFLPAPAPPSTLPPGCTANGDGSFTFVTPEVELEGGSTEIGEHWGLFGIWVRPVREFRMNFDVELMSADNSFTRISPRHLQNYRARIQYKPSTWVILAMSLNMLENRNTVFQVNNLQHDRGANFSANFQPWEKFGLDLNYEYDDTFSKIDICYAFTPAPPGSSPCPVSASGVAPIAGVSLYDSATHFGSFDLFWKPVHRVTFRTGYALTSVTGNTTFLNPNSPPGSLAFNYHKPYAGLDVDLVKGLTWRTSWGYYGYNEKTPPDLFTAARDFRGNLASFSLRYSF